MATSYHGFLIELYEEYLEEASFLYEQRLGLFDDPEITWLDIDDWEQRIEAHIDGLVVGNALALEVCQRQATDGDFGELYAAICVFCRQHRKELVIDAMENLDFEDAERVRAVTDALKYELPTDWQDDLRQRLSTAYPDLSAMLAEVIGYRRIPASAELLAIMSKTPGKFLPPIIQALGRLKDQSARVPLCRYLEHDEPSVRIATVRTLLRLGEKQALAHCIQNLEPESELLIPVGLGGDQGHARTLMDFARNGSASDHGLIALGLLGDPQALDILVSHLESEHAEAATLGLQLLTGAAPLEEVFVPEEIDEDELFEEELRQYKTEGKVPTRTGGQPFGENITRLSRNPEHWLQWLNDNRSRFRPGTRYRAGQPCSPEVLLQAMLGEHTAHQARWLTADELTIRYQHDWQFEIDLTVERQQRLLSEATQKFAGQVAVYQSGVWYFDGRILKTSLTSSTRTPDAGRARTTEHRRQQPSPSKFNLDATALWRLRDNLVHHPLGTLVQLTRLDQILTARLEELYAAGGTSWGHAEEALEQNIEGAVFVTTLLALKSKRPEHLQTVIRAGRATPATFRELVSALGWLSYERIADWIDQLLASRFPYNRLIGLATCSVHRHDPGSMVLTAAADDPDPFVQARALRMIGELKRRDLTDKIESTLNSSDPACRFWSAWSGTLLWQRTAMGVLRHIAETESPWQNKALQLLLRSMKPSDSIAWLRNLAATAGQQAILATGIGIAGLPDGIPWLLKKMRTDELAEPAGAAFLAITGLRTFDDAGKSTLSGHLPNSVGFEEAEQWWTSHKEMFESGVRHLDGKPVDVARCRELLGKGRQRQAAALELALLQVDKPLFEVRAPSLRQQNLLSQNQ